ncbi:MAG TPA: hypothetical protein VG407_11155 [Caulobacteraceae bacterium]|jgi:hypothetical protein|nr:hypothetical protein [Caulobacteraceae bacterium]
MRRLRNAVLGVLVTGVLSIPYVASGQAQPEAQGQSSYKDAPVLCVWEVLLATQLVADKCHVGEDPALQAELASSIKRVDGFISANDATATPDKVAAFKQSFRDQSSSPDFCSNQQAQAMYADAKRAGADRIRTDTDQLVSVPRKPTKEGC